MMEPLTERDTLLVALKLLAFVVILAMSVIGFIAAMQFLVEAL
jgi:hypothetical protein